MKKLLVIGGNIKIGNEIDLTNPHLTYQAFEKHKPAHIIHCVGKVGGVGGIFI